MKDADMSDPEEDEPSQDNSNDGSEQDEQSREEDEEEDDDDDDDLGNDPFTSAFLNRAHPLGLTGAMRALSGLMMGMSSQLRDILTQLRQKDDPTVQLIALQELSQILLMSTEDTLSGQFSPDPYVKELVSLMQPPEFGEENPEIMVLACRCLAHLMDVLRGSVANVVYGGAVPVLCQKLLDIQYIDLAEQALSVSNVQISFACEDIHLLTSLPSDSRCDLRGLPRVDCA
jgi:E3 ubiquitin-protein ligase TRIP12